MKNTVTSLLFCAVCVLFTPVFVSGEEEGSAAIADTGDVAIPQDIRNNKFYLDSVNFRNLAQKSYDEGDYDESASYSEQAQESAKKSDEYVALQLKIRASNNAIHAAKVKLVWAESDKVQAPKRFPDKYAEGNADFGDAVKYRMNADYDNSITSAQAVLAALEGITEFSPEPETWPLPAQYTVRKWENTKDCLWNIAGRPEIYGNPWKWRKLYNANKATLPEKGNPNDMDPGEVLNIPSRHGEHREGMWEPGRKYQKLKK
jgi:hypothetical protein